MRPYEALRSYNECGQQVSGQINTPAKFGDSWGDDVDLNCFKCNNTVAKLKIIFRNPDLVRFLFDFFESWLFGH